MTYMEFFCGLDFVFFFHGFYLSFSQCTNSHKPNLLSHMVNSGQFYSVMSSLEKCDQREYCHGRIVLQSVEQGTSSCLACVGIPNPPILNV